MRIARVMRTTLGDVKDCADNLVERKITQDASGNRSVRRTFFFFALEGLFSLSLSLSRSIDSLVALERTPGSSLSYVAHGGSDLM